jgi:hypothetical protein
VSGERSSVGQVAGLLEVSMNDRCGFVSCMLIGARDRNR